MDFKTRLVEITNANCKKIKVSNFQKYNHLLEMADLRNSIIHQEHLQMQGTVETFDKVNNKIKIHLISRSEFYTHSKLQKNVRLVDYFDAIKSNEIVDEFVDWLKINLKRPEDFINTFSIVAHNIKSRSRKLKIGSSLQIEIKGRGEDLIDMASYWPNTKMTFRL